MKEHPILMTTDMVKAILDNLKSMTRRTYGLEKVNKNPDEWEYKGIEDLAPRNIHLFKHMPTDSFLNIKCPYGQVGDILWCKETWYPNPATCTPIYKADYPLEEKPQVWSADAKWRPSIFMPRWASRIDSEITDIRVEKLQDITEEDAVKEGCIAHHIHIVEGILVNSSIGRMDYITARENYKNLWNSINGQKYPWSSNPWVWPIEFRRIKP